ncbi:unnamed protein product [Rhizophagus irregularis]|nr:unnamed protein product [Rhizophagus irregularis]
MCSFPRADGNYIPPYGFSSFSPDDYVFNSEPFESTSPINDTLIEDNVSSNTSFPLISTSSIVDNSFLVSFEKFHVTKVKESGFKTIYDFKSFFFKIIYQLPDTNEIHLKMHTNVNYPNSLPFHELGITYSSTYHARDAKLILQLVAKRSISERLDEFKKKAYDFESVRAAKNGISVKKLRLCDIQKQSLTDINDAFHEHMSEFRKCARRTTAPLHPKWLVEEMKEFMDRFPIACQHMKADLLQDSYNVDFSTTSDDAKEIKTRHNKRTVTNNYNLDFSYSKPDEKRQRHHDKRIFDPHNAFKYF